MVTVVREPGFGENLGNSLGTGVASALEQLAKNKIEKKRKQDTISGLSSLFSPEQAAALADLDPEILKPIVSEKVKSQRQLATTGPGIETIAPDLTPDQASKIGSLPASVQSLWYKNYLENPTQAIESLNNSPNTFTPKDIKTFAKSNLDTLKQDKTIAPTEQKKLISEFNKQLTSELPKQPKAEFIETPKKVSDYMKEGFDKSEAKDIVKDERKRIAQSEKESLKYYQDTLKQADASKDADKRLDRMSTLIEKGSLPNSLFYNLFEHLSKEPIKTHIPLVGPVVDLVLGTAAQSIGGVGKSIQRSITSRDTEEFEKLTNDFVKDAKSIFGSRVTNLDLEQFLKTLPSLSQTDNGKKAVIRNLKNFNAAVQLKAKAVKDILKKTKGRRPANLEVLVEERIKPEMDKLAEEFVQGNKQEQPTQNTGTTQWPWQQILQNNL